MRPVLRAHEIDARKADENAEALTQRDRLVIDQQTDREQRVIEDGTLFTIGATSIILHTDNIKG